jgi:hypothetical protein
MMRRRTLTPLLIVLLLAPELPARTNRDWENVKKLKPGTIVQIWLWSGDILSGEVDAVSDAGLQLATADRSAPQANWLRQVDRTTIRRIVRFRQPNLPNSNKWMITGAVGGGAIGVTAGAIADLKQGSNYHWFEGALGGAGMGFLFSCAALAAVGSVDLAQGLRRGRVVYEDKGNHPPNGDPKSATPNLLHPITPDSVSPKVTRNDTAFSGGCGDPESRVLCPSQF